MTKLRFYRYGQLVINESNKTVRIEIDESWNRNNPDCQDKIQGEFKDMMQEYFRLIDEDGFSPG